MVKLLLSEDCEPRNEQFGDFSHSVIIGMDEVVETISDISGQKFPTVYKVYSRVTCIDSAGHVFVVDAGALLPFFKHGVVVGIGGYLIGIGKL